MSISWGRALVSLIALVISLIAMNAVVVAADAIRKRDYRLFKDMSRKEVAMQFPLPPVNQSSAELLWQDISQSLNEAHRAANETHIIYHNTVA